MRKVKIQVPETLNEIKLSQYQKYLRVTKDLEDENEKARRMVAVFCNLTDVIVRNMTKQSFDETLLHLSKILDVNDDIELIRIFKHKGESYGFIPNMDDMTVGELADIDANITDWQKMDIVMGILYRPTTSKFNDKYTIEDYDGKGYKLDAPLDVALSAYFFLTNLLKDLLLYIPNSIKSIIQQDPKSRSLVENGGGINPFMESLRATCSSLSVSLN